MATITSAVPATRLARPQAVEQIVTAAIRVLAEDGPTQIKARSVAQAAGVSTSALYYHLGGLPELLQAVVDHGFTDLAIRFDAIPNSGDPVSDLFGMALATRHFATENPHLYDLMFGLSTRGSYRAPQGICTSRQSLAFQSVYTYLVDAASRLVRSGRVRSDADPGSVADQLWCCVHGFVALELGGHFTHLADPVAQRLQPLTVNVFVGLGDLAERADASHDNAATWPPTGHKSGWASFGHGPSETVGANAS